MGKKIRTYFNTLKGTISLLLSLAMILGLITGIVATANAIRAASEQIYLTNRNELGTYMTAIDNELAKIEEEINIVIEDYWFFYRGMENNDCFEVYDFIQNLRKVRIRNDSVKAIFTLSELETVPDWIGYDSDDISYAEGTVIKNVLKNGMITPEKTRETQIIQIEETCYLCYYVYNLSAESCIGVLYDIKDMLADLSGGSEDSRSYFMDKGGTLYGISGRENLLDSDNIPGNDGIYPAGDYVGIVENSKRGEFAVVRLMTRNDILLNPSKSYLVFLLMAVLIIMMNPVIGMVLDRRVYKPLGRLHNAMQEIEHDNLDFRMTETEGTEEFEYTKKVFNTMADEIKTLRIKAYEEEIERLQMEARNLRLQVSPHMLQNSLNIIYNLSLSNNNKVIQKFVPCLSDYFRYSLEKHGELVPVKNEIEFVDNYLKVQKIRFPDRLLFVYDVNRELLEAMVPPLLIQNFVENTVKYGLKEEEEIEIIIVIKEDRESSRLTISIVDTGAGMKPEVLEKVQQNEPYRDRNGEHIGIWNCRKRLHMLYGDRAVVNITSQEDQGTQVWMELPLIYEGGLK